MKDQIQSALLGLAVGDALGVPVEFKIKKIPFEEYLFLKGYLVSFFKFQMLALLQECHYCQTLLLFSCPSFVST